MTTVVLASGSPRRKALLETLGLDPVVAVPGVDESLHPGERPASYVQRLAAAKAAAVGVDSALVIAADTTVDVDGEVLGKPADAAEAAAMLARLAGRSHLVHTGVAVRLGVEQRVGVSTTAVTFAALDAALIRWYVATGEPLDKAGGYALQGAAGAFVTSIEGSASNVVGLPLHLVVALAAELGVPLVGR